MSDERMFFSRQGLLPQVSLPALRKSSVLVLGLGNVGSPTAGFLALAGIGKLVLVDNDDVKEENLSKGIFTRQDLGKTKVEATAGWIRERTPYTEVETLCADLRVEVPEQVFSSHDAVVPATDSWSSRAYANRWAHALAGKTRVVVSGGLNRMDWDVITSVPGSGLGCAQCPHSADLLRADEEGGCGLLGGNAPDRADPSIGFMGAMVAAVMVMEVARALSGGAPGRPGSMLSFDFETRELVSRRIMPDPRCPGHRRLAEYQDVVTVPVDDYRVADLAGLVAAETGAGAGAVTLAFDRELVRGRRCLACSHYEAVRKPLVVARPALGRPCPRCGGETFDIETHTVLDEPDLRLSQTGVVPGKALRAFAGEREVLVLPLSPDDVSRGGSE